MFLKLLLAVIITQFADISALLNCCPLILTPYIESQRFNELRRLSYVQYLPNAPKLDSYSGYLTVNKEFDSNLFFWFFPALVRINLFNQNNIWLFRIICKSNIKFFNLYLIFIKVSFHSSILSVNFGKFKNF